MGVADRFGWLPLRRTHGLEGLDREAESQSLPRLDRIDARATRAQSAFHRLRPIAALWRGLGQHGTQRIACPAANSAEASPLECWRVPGSVERVRTHAQREITLPIP